VAGQLILVFGGPGPEHEVGLASALSVGMHLARRGWKLLEAGVTKDGRWLIGPGALSALLGEADTARLPARLACADRGPRVPENSGPVLSFSSPPPAAIFAGYPMAFLACHGRWGQDGGAQRLLASYGLRTVGCDDAATALCFDKQRTKEVLGRAGLAVSPGLTVTVEEFAADPGAVRARVRKELGDGAWFVKPARGGSSIGIARVADPQEFKQAMDGAFRWDSVALVEEYVPHRELVVGVIGRDQLVISPPGECVPVGALYTYEEKYRLGNPYFTCPAEVDHRMAERIRDLSECAFRALGCSVMARVDFFVDKRDGRLLINEVNSIPGMTEVSVFPNVMEAAGFPYPELLEELCRLAIQ
jgi:D-alanine-D-alanine ligase